MAKLILKPGQTYEELAQELLEQVLDLSSSLDIANHLAQMNNSRYKEANAKVISYSHERMEIAKNLRELGFNLMPNGVILHRNEK